MKLFADEAALSAAVLHCQLINSQLVLVTCVIVLINISPRHQACMHVTMTLST